MKIFRLVSLADSLSVLNALLGFSGVTYLLLYGDVGEAFRMLCLASLVDGVDGLVAEKTEKSAVGKQLDSFGDAISFGVLPASMLVIFSPHFFPLAALLLAFAVLRLARFNVENFTDFYGLPTLPNALLVASLILLDVDAKLLAAIVAVTSILMVSDIVYPRLKRSLLIAGAIVAAAAILKEPALTALASAAYVLSPVAKRLYGRGESGF
ncbi:MAG: CDP-diacylglycerol--serine O-phosphatidyltransferase [Archaeoglobaceae archaeon]